MIKKIYKFGGASVKDADAVRNLADIVSQHKDEDILLVVSAMGKTTNALEKALADFREHDGQLGMEALHAGPPCQVVRRVRGSRPRLFRGRWSFCP